MRPNLKVRHLYISKGHNFFGRHGLTPENNAAIEVAEIECVTGRGIRGDRFFDFKEDYQGQVTFFSWETFVDLCGALKLSGKSPAQSRRNIIVEGIDLNRMIGREFEVQGVRFLGTSQCAPCYWMDQAFAPGAEAFLQNRGGLRAVVLTDGKLLSES